MKTNKKWEDCYGVFYQQKPRVLEDAYKFFNQDLLTKTERALRHSDINNNWDYFNMSLKYSMIRGHLMSLLELE